MSRESEYYEQFGTMSCSDVGDRPTFTESDESGFSEIGDNAVASEAGDKPGLSDDEEADAAGA